MIDFKTSGSLDISTGSSQLPDNGLQRAKNVNLGTRGHITLRRGSFRVGKVANSQSDETFDFLIEQGGDRYYFTADGSIYKNEFQTEALFDSDELQLYDVNGNSLFVISEGSANEL
jgi:hypothetical protein